MSERIFKKRMLMLLGSTGVCGVSTFVDNFLHVLDKNDICVDLLDIYRSGIKSGNPDLSKHENVGLVVNAWEGRDNLVNDHKFLEHTMYPFLSKRRAYCTALETYVVHRKIFELMNTNIYDFIFINENEPMGSSAVLDFYAFSDCIKVVTYSHSYDIFGFPGEPANNSRACRFRSVRNSINSDKRVIFLTQLDPEVMQGWLKDTVNTRKIGLPLNIEDYRKYQIPDSEKEDRLLYIGRVDDTAKNPLLWIAVANRLSDRVRGTVIVPTRQQAAKFDKYCAKIGYKNYDIYHSLTFDEKMKLSAKCKCFFSSSNYETFGYTVYENLALMPVITNNMPWAHLVKRELPCITIADKKSINIHEQIWNLMQNYSGEEVTKQYDIVKAYRDSCVEKWSDFLNEPNIMKDDSEPDPDAKNVVLLSKHHDISLIAKVNERDWLSLEELEVIYKNMDWNKVIQTRTKSYYGKLKESKTYATLDAFF